MKTKKSRSPELFSGRHRRTRKEHGPRKEHGSKRKPAKSKKRGGVDLRGVNTFFQKLEDLREADNPCSGYNFPPDPKKKRLFSGPDSALLWKKINGISWNPPGVAADMSDTLFIIGCRLQELERRLESGYYVKRCKHVSPR